MKILITLLITLFASLSFAQNEAFDSELAKQLGADDYGMKKYVLVTLLTGPLINASPKRGIFNYEMVEYYGSAALMQINDIHKTLQKNAIE
jgi:ATP/ADP translocase